MVCVVSLVNKPLTGLFCSMVCVVSLVNKPLTGLVKPCSRLLQMSSVVVLLAARVTGVILIQYKLREAFNKK